MPRRSGIGSVAAFQSANNNRFSKRTDEHASLSQLRESGLMAAPQRQISSKMKRTHSDRRIRGEGGQWNSESLAMQFATHLEEQRHNEREHMIYSIPEDRISAMSAMSGKSTKDPQATRHGPCAHRIQSTVQNEPTLPQQGFLGHKKAVFMSSFARVEKKVGLSKRFMAESSTPARTRLMLHFLHRRRYPTIARTDQTSNQRLIK